MLDKLLFVALCFHQYRLINCVRPDLVDNRTETFFKFTADELLNTVFPTTTTNDLDLDPCKAGKQTDFISSLVPHDKLRRVKLHKKLFVIFKFPEILISFQASYIHTYTQMGSSDLWNAICNIRLYSPLMHTKNAYHEISFHSFFAQKVGGESRTRSMLFI